MKWTVNRYIIALLSGIVVCMLVVPAIADYSGDHPLTIYEHGMVNGGGLVYEAVTDGSAYTKLPCNVYPEDPEYGLTQAITINIPEGKTVKTARLYNYVTWSTSDNDSTYVKGAPAEADLSLTNVDTGVTWERTCKHGMPSYDGLSNPIDYGNGVIQYWDTKGEYYDCGIKYDFPSGTFAWDVTDLVTGSGVYTAEIVNADSTPTGMRPGKPYDPYGYRERFATYGFGLLVVYENADPDAEPDTEYWITEGCDLLYNTSKYGVYEPIATTSAMFDKEMAGAEATLTTVLTASDKWNLTDWDESKNMVSFNGNEIGPSTAESYKAIGVNEFDVTGYISDSNTAESQDRDLGTGKGDNSVVSNAFLVMHKIPAGVTFDKKKIDLNSNGILKAFITLPDGYDVADIDVNTVECEGADVFGDGSVIPGKNALEVKFKIRNLNVSAGDEVLLTVTGELTDGKGFAAHNTIKVVE